MPTLIVYVNNRSSTQRHFAENGFYYKGVKFWKAIGEH